MFYQNLNRLESSSLMHSIPKEIHTENFLNCTTSEDKKLEDTKLEDTELEDTVEDTKPEDTKVEDTYHQVPSQKVNLLF